MSNQQSPSNLDEAIDRAVRRIVEVEPPPGLEGRVRARLAAPVRRGLSVSMGWAAAAAMLTLMVAAGVMLREQRDAAPGSPAVLSSRASGAPAQPAAEVDEARASQAAPSIDQMAALNAVPQPAGPAATAPPPLEAKARKADGRDEREMAALPVAGPGAAAALNLPPAESAPSISASAVADTVTAARPSTTAVASGLASRSRAAVAATPVLGTALDANEAAPATALTDKADGAATGSADRLEISPLRLPPLRIDPLTIAPIPDTDRQP
ncbi:MAG: hypothetical protein ABJC51_04305 [Acidobacteriota bacterium]